MNISLCAKKIIDVGMRESYVPKFLRKYNWIVYVDYTRPYTQWVNVGRSIIPIHHSSQIIEYKFVEKTDAVLTEKKIYTSHLHCTRCGNNINKCKYTHDE